MRRWWIPLTVCLLALGCGTDGTDDDDAASPVDKIAQLTGDATAGESLYQSNCAGCHGADGKSGSAGPPITEGTRAALPAKTMITAVVNGVGVMPAFTNLSDQQVADVVAYVRGPLTKSP